MNPDISHHYKILELEQGASQPEIKRAYRDLAMVWHPDRFSNPRMQQKAEARLKQINAAYEFLKSYQPQTEKPTAEPVEPETENRKIIQLCTWKKIASKIVTLLLFLVLAWLAWRITVLLTILCFKQYSDLVAKSLPVHLAFLAFWLFFLTFTADVFVRRVSIKARD
ncbi:MAG: J domain-containing protein [Cyanobacteria bacterium CAN_BIN43]|nr:J domain-containing protein [Cyanobacteria bacterium CAN_BIN43]